LADRWLAGLLGDERDVALLAVGGYGRSELCPGSDLDLVLLHRGRKDVKTIADRIWYPIWDAGIGLDHSVRTPKEALRMAESDLKVALGLLDGRHIAGDAELSADVIEASLQRFRKHARRWLAALADQVEERHARFGEVAYLLEPDLKEGRGGLRDIHALRAAVVATSVVPDQAPELAEAHDILLSARVELHRLSGRALDRLLLEDQDAVAAALDHRDADALMSAVAGAARAIGWVSDDAWRRVRSWLAGPRGRQATSDRPLGAGVLLREGEVVLDPATPLDAASPVWAGVAAAGSGAPLSRAALDRLAAEAPAPSDPWSSHLRDGLVALLGTGPAAIPVLEALDQKGLLVRLLPEWEAVRSRPQRNAYHRFTVDRHLCEAAVQAARFTRDVSRPDLLLVGTWLHDIGKGFPGDHTEAGMTVVEKIATRMGFEPDDVTVLVDMVRHHLLLPDVATRRDLRDPRTAELVAEAVGRRDVLELLAALTEADSLATGPAAWSEWKAGLVRELVSRAGHLLEGGTPPAPPSLVTDEIRALMASGELEVRVEGSHVTVVAPDRPGLFSRVAGALALNALDVRSAAADSEGDMAVEVFDVDAAFGPPDWDRVADDIRAAVGGRLALEARLAERARAYAPRRPSAAGGPAAPRVLVENDASAAATVIEVRAPDRIGVLYRITRALADCELDVRSAKISTLGHEVVDAFYVCGAGGGKVDDAEHLAAIEQTVLSELAR
jgi:[protein-PII] uridylyltransferase